MAYMSQDKKRKIEPEVKKILKKFGIKGRLGVDNHSSLVLNITEGRIDFCALRNLEDARWKDPNFEDRWVGHSKDFYMQVNTYWINDHWTGKARDFLNEVIAAMNVGNHNNSDISTDYHDVGWYINVNLGKWNSPYKVLR